MLPPTPATGGDDDRWHVREAPGAAVFYWLALAAMVVIPIVLFAAAAR